MAARSAGALGEADLPTPEDVFEAPLIGFKQAVTLVIGPSLIALGLSIGSGEWLLAPLAIGINVMYLISRLPRPARAAWWSYVILVTVMVYFGYFFINFFSNEVFETDLSFW